jgi:hypothetical protein
VIVCDGLIQLLRVAIDLTIRDLTYYDHEDLGSLQECPFREQMGYGNSVSNTIKGFTIQGQDWKSYQELGG